MVSAIIVAQAAVRASGARRRLVLGIQHQTSYPAALHKVSLQNLLGLLDGAIVIPDALRIDDHRRAQLAAVETAGLVDADSLQAEFLDARLQIIAQADAALVLADRQSKRLNSRHECAHRQPSSAVKTKQP